MRPARPVEVAIILNLAAERDACVPLGNHGQAALREFR
jgi:hypothetical protein